MTTQELKATREYQEILNYYVDSGMTLKQATALALADMQKATA